MTQSTQSPATLTAEPPGRSTGARLMVAISARALFDLEEGHRLFESEGVEAYAEYQRGLENERLAPGIAFPLVRKLLALNTLVRAHAPRAVQAGQIQLVAVLLLSR